VKKQQFIVVGAGLVLLISLYFFGNTTPPKAVAVAPVEKHDETKPVESTQLLKHAKERLTPEQLQWVNAIENSVSRGDIKNQQIAVYKQLASYWADSLHLFEPYAYYLAEAAKLENQEKSLTFAAHLFLNNLKTEREPSMQKWLASNAKVLFEQALQLNPANDSSKIGLGACYIFGGISSNPMEGITPIRDIVAKNPDNMFGQFILGLGGVRSGQFDKAIERFLIVVKKEPNNLEATLNLAEAYEQKGDKANAVTWYKVVKSKIPNPEAQQELEKRIKALQ
jgi:tetratricopeptide (TPR) repeat protein